MHKIKEIPLKKLIVLILTILIVILILIIILFNKKSEEKVILYSQDKIQVKNNMENISNESFDIFIEERKITDSQADLHINIDNIQENNTYNLVFNEKGNEEQKKIVSEKTMKTIELNQGVNIITVKIYRNGQELIYEGKAEVEYLKPYEKQFMDELSNRGFAVHYRDGTWEKYENDFDLLKNSGIKYIRADFLWRKIDKGKGDYQFDYYDDWIKKATENNIEIVAILNGVGTLAGENEIIDNEEERKKFVNFAVAIAKKYPQIVKYEILNEPNFDYRTDEQINQYIQLVKQVSEALKQINSEIDIISGVCAVPDKTTSYVIESSEFIENISDNGAYQYSDAFSYHPYDSNNIGELNTRYKEQLEKNSKIINKIGGFTKNYITEFGISSYENVTEEDQAIIDVQRTIINDDYGIDLSILYSSWNMGNDRNSKEQNFGILNNNYTPKLSYYALKNCYENINGAEFIGNISLINGVETYVYNKNGEPLLILWSKQKDKNYSLEISNCYVKDLYGNDVQIDNGKINISYSPIYLYGQDKKYFSQAISNKILTSYDELTKNYIDILEETSDINNEIESLKEEIKKLENISYDESIQLMERHYELGMKYMEIFQCNNDEDYKRLSSFLDSLDTIGESYQDIITISENVQNISLNETGEKIKIVNGNLKYIDNINENYPIRILNFAKEYYEKACYISELEENNPIKNGLVSSYNKHAEILTDWANRFADIYINKYINENPITVSYSTEDLTNEDVIVVLNVPNETEIVNNDGNNEYIFKDNGTFVFEYSIKGKKFTKTVEVNNIDKLAPIIKNVENNKTYQNITVTPQIEDDNLSEIVLLKDGQVVDNYNNGDNIDELGTYILKARDLAGNETKVEFKIIEKENNDYFLEGDNIILNCNKKTKQEFASYFDLFSGYKLLDNQNELKDDDLIKTGINLITSDNKIYNIIVLGDLNSDGKVNITDVMIMKKNIVEDEWKDDIIKLSADLNMSKNINITDVMLLKNKIVNTKY